MFRMMSPAKPDDIQLSAVVFMMTLRLGLAAYNARQSNQRSTSHCPLYCSMRLSLLRVLQSKLLGVLAIVPWILVANFPNPCAVAFPTASFQSIWHSCILHKCRERLLFIADSTDFHFVICARCAVAPLHGAEAV